MSMYDITIVGGGIIGLSIGWALTRRHPKARILVLEKENRWGHHQTGHNSGEIHSGIYYHPGSLKARFSREGNEAMVKFCRDFGIPHEVCGKLIVATEAKELGSLERLYARGLVNGIEVRKLSADEIKEIEPFCAGLAGLQVPSTGIVDYRHVAQTFADLIQKRDGELRLNTEVKEIKMLSSGLQIESSSASFHSRFLINCAGLQCDRVAQLMGIPTGMQIVPIRGEYYSLRAEKRHLVKNIIYPLPNPHYPFLGVHLNRLMNGQIRAGPSAVISFNREGYDKNHFHLRDATKLVTSRSFWAFGARNWREGSKEYLCSRSKTLLTRRLRKLVPQICSDDLEAKHAGIRAQALMHNGQLMDDFVILQGPHSIHICNAPSPAATGAISIGNAVVDRIQQQGLL